MLARSVARATVPHALVSVFRAGEVGHRLGELGKIGGETVTTDACIVEGSLDAVRILEAIFKVKNRKTYRITFVGSSGGGLALTLQAEKRAGCTLSDAPRSCLWSVMGELTSNLR